MKKEITLTKEQFIGFVGLFCYGFMTVTGKVSGLEQLQALGLVISSTKSLTDTYEKMKSLFEDIKDKEGMITISCDKLEVKL